MGKALLFSAGHLSEVCTVAVGDQCSGKIIAKNVARDFARSCGIELKVNELFVLVNPEIQTLAIERPVGFVSIINNGFSRLGKLDFKTEQYGGREADAEQLVDYLRNFAIRDADLIMQVDRLCPQVRSNTAAQ